MSELKVTLVKNHVVKLTDGEDFISPERNISGVLEVKPAFPIGNLAVNLNYFNGEDVRSETYKLASKYLDFIYPMLLREIQKEIFSLTYPQLLNE